MFLANVVVIGAQWGDEGKGKITDLLSRSADVVVRYQGGVNAGHTIVVDDRVLKLHLIPSGILYPDTICLIGSGTVVDPKVMLGELDMLIANDIDISGLRLASTAHVTMPYHRLLDQAMEKQRGARRIGTTGRGIGPTYADKSQRSGIRVIDLLDEQRLRDRLEGPLQEKNELLQTIYGVAPLNAEDVIQEYLGYGKRLAPPRGGVHPDDSSGSAGSQEHPVRRCPGHVVGPGPRHLPLRHVLQSRFRRCLHRCRRGPDPD